MAKNANSQHISNVKSIVPLKHLLTEQENTIELERIGGMKSKNLISNFGNLSRNSAPGQKTLLPYFFKVS